MISIQKRSDEIFLHANHRGLLEDAVRQGGAERAGRPKAVHVHLAADANEPQGEREKLYNPQGGAAVRARVTHRLSEQVADVLQRSHGHLFVEHRQCGLLFEGPAGHRLRDCGPRAAQNTRGDEYNHVLQGLDSVALRQRSCRVVVHATQGAQQQECRDHVSDVGGHRRLHIVDRNQSDC